MVALLVLIPLLAPAPDGSQVPVAKILQVRTAICVLLPMCFYCVH